MGARPSAFAQPVVEVKPQRVWSPAQQAIFDWFEAKPIRWYDAERINPADLVNLKPGDYIPVLGGSSPAMGIIEGPKNLVVRARAGCLAGDTYISVNRAGAQRTYPIAEIVAKFNGVPWPKSKGWDLSIPTMVQREQDGVIRLGKLKAAWASGVKQTYVVTTDSGKTIRATDEHPFMTADGWYRLDGLKVGTLLLMRGSQSTPCSKSKTTYSDESDMWNHPFAVVRPPDKSHPNGAARVATHRLVVEADQNGLDYQDYLWSVRSGQTAGHVFLDPTEWAVHHKDRNTQNNTIGNLEVLSPKDHHRLHGLEDAMANVLFKVTYEQVVAIEPFEMEETFDIEVEDDPHNFIANGFVVHNTGKTTTIIEGVNRAPEASVLVCAFNKRIADELNSRLDNPRAEAKTLHSLGLGLVRREWRGMPVNSVKEHKVYRSDTLTDQAFKASGTREAVPYPIRRMVTTLHTKAREMCPLEATSHALTALAVQFDLVPDEGWRAYDLDFVVTHALLAMHEAATVPPSYDIGVDYADMLFLPLIWNLTSKDYDLVVVDECQDMSLAQLELAERVCGGRICVCGDDRQSIYSFRNCDSQSLDRLKTKLGALELPLNTTYRCGTAIVAHAQRLVPDILAGPSNPVGLVDACTTADLLTMVRPGDFVLSRLNAPLVSITLRLLRAGVRATMAGRDVGAGVIAVLKKLKVTDRMELFEIQRLVEAWERKQVSKLAAMGLTEDIDRIRDQANVLYAFIQDSETTKQMFQRLDTLFTNVEGETVADSVLCSSVHKAKGLEADRVFVLMDTLYRRGRTPEEENIEYVAVTRAKTHLTLVRE